MDLGWSSLHPVSSTMGSPRENTPKRRLACDRCHARKLRCSRDPTGCLRCVRDRSVCNYSPALKVGRPSKASMAARDTHTDPSQTPSDTTFFALPDAESMSTDSGISVPTPHSHSPGDMAPGSLGTSDTGAPSWMAPGLGPNGFLFDCFGMSNPGAIEGDHALPSLASPMLDPQETMLDPRLRCASPPKNSTNWTHTMERLLRLQQELLHTRMPSTVPGTPSSSSSRTWSVDAALKPGQETVEVIRDLLHQVPRENDRPDSGSVCADWQTALHLILTPLSLLLSTYGEIARGIRTAASFTAEGSAPGSPSPGLVDSIALRLGDLRLDRQLRLILLATIIEYQLNQLHRALRLFQSKHMQSGNLGVAEGMQSSAMAELQSKVRTLLSFTKNILHPPPET
ncbi:hypothetical protein BDV26DRAFT_257408 [Aspergillus bertholletiae]|uniref:Zn(2)-C6 fungal-type domain-containing protein n=1 Tax=Aspergillus bertholletiae TaxID=1226010 RepID=A0A5N7BFU0_9EURO|nr:hypothetical protein BDV26DRAFT_257408 [Aspergillus bertholletiae]